MSLAAAFPAAIQAHKLSTAGLQGKAMGEKLKVTTAEANNLAAIGRQVVEIDAARLSDAEVLLLRSIAKVLRLNLAAGRVRSPESTEVAWAAGRSPGWPSATCRKRLGSGANWDTKRQAYGPVGLGFVELTGNGYVNLTALGWMFVHALEAAEAAIRP